jgi:hypothetical protein
MPLLILAIASLLFFFLVVALLWIANTLESRTIRRRRILIPTESLAPLSINEAFEPIYSVLWEAPIAALELVQSAGPSGIPVARLRPIYRQAATRFPEIYDGCGFVEWLRFLEATDLIFWAGCKIVLTPEGKAFLRYRFVTDALVEA